MEDFTIDPSLIQFDSTETPQIGAQVAYTNEVLEKITKAEHAGTDFLSGFPGAYKTDNTGKAVQAPTNFVNGCRTDYSDVNGKVIPILSKCSDLASKIAELRQLKEQADALKAERDRLDPEEDAGRIAQINARIRELKQQFDAKQEEALALLAELKGMDATISPVVPTNGTLSQDPNITVDATKGYSGKEQYYNYQIGDQSITSINQ